MNILSPNVLFTYFLSISIHVYVGSQPLREQGLSRVPGTLPPWIAAVAHDTFNDRMGVSTGHSQGTLVQFPAILRL